MAQRPAWVAALAMAAWGCESGATLPPGAGGSAGAPGGGGGAGGSWGTWTSSSGGAGGSLPPPKGEPWENPIWERTYIGSSAWARDVAVAPDGTIYLCGATAGSVTIESETITTEGGMDLFMLAFYADGALLATRQVGGPGDGANCAGIGVQPDGTVIVAGTLRSQVDFGDGPLAPDLDDLFVAAFDPGLAPLWSVRFGGAGDQTMLEAAVDDSGNILVVGRYDGVLAFGSAALPNVDVSLPHDGFVAKLDAGGVGLWAWAVGSATHQDEIRAVAANAAGDVLLCGRAGGSYTVAGGPTQPRDPDASGYVARLTPAGAHVFDRRMPIFPFEECAVAAAPEGGLVVGYDFAGTHTLAGVTLSAEGIDMALSRFDGGGAALAAVEFEADPSMLLVEFPPEEYVGELVVDGAGRTIATGHIEKGLDLGDGPIPRPGMFVAARAPDLAPAWAEHHTDLGNAYGAGVALHPDGSVVAVGHGSSEDGALLLVVKLPR